jgi:hypothetical protein
MMACLTEIIDVNPMVGQRSSETLEGLLNLTGIQNIIHYQDSISLKCFDLMGAEACHGVSE